MKGSIKIFLLLLIATLIVLPKVLAEEGKISAGEAWQKIKRGALLVDVRTPAEFQTAHADGAINVPHDQVEQKLDEFGNNKKREIVLYCRSGNRSGVAQEALKKNGFQNVFNAGGLKDLEAGKPKS